MLASSGLLLLDRSLPYLNTYESDLSEAYHNQIRYIVMVGRYERMWRPKLRSASRTEVITNFYSHLALKI